MKATLTTSRSRAIAIAKKLRNEGFKAKVVSRKRGTYTLYYVEYSEKSNPGSGPMRKRKRATTRRRKTARRKNPNIRSANLKNFTGKVMIGADKVVRILGLSK